VTAGDVYVLAETGEKEMNTGFWLRILSESDTLEKK
jgi:hypothetical protein